MQIADYYPILVQILIASSIGVVVLVASHIFGQRGTDTAIKNTPYECGMLAEGSGHARFAVKFYVTAMLFILFDIEVVFLIPWVMVFREFLAANFILQMMINKTRNSFCWGSTSRHYTSQGKAIGFQP